MKKSDGPSRTYTGIATRSQRKPSFGGSSVPDDAAARVFLGAE